MENNQETQPKKESIGALWENVSGSGKKYYSGNITFQGSCGKTHYRKVVMFTNDYKETDRHPSFKLYESEAPKEHDLQRMPTVQTYQEMKVSDPELKDPLGGKFYTKPYPVEDIDPDQIPF